MELSKAQVLITGGSEGIGKALAQRFWATGSRVMITGRNLSKLKTAATQLPGLEYIVNDISQAHSREQLAQYLQTNMPGINILINNAGIQRRIGLAKDRAPWPQRQNEIDTLLSGPVHLNHLLVPLLLQKESIIINVTSGGAYIPQVFAPVYSACKAALHHYTMVLRHSLQNTSCRVVELIPPAVQTGLAGPGQQHGVTLNDFANHIFNQLTTSNETSIGYGPTANLEVTISGKRVNDLFETSAGRFPVERY